MTVKLTDYQENIIKTIAENEGITRYNLTAKPATEKGDGYLGSLLSVTIKNDENNLHIILKQAEQSDDAEHRLFTRKAYVREVYVYDKVLREFEILQKQNNAPNVFTAYPKVYASSDAENGEYLALENLKETGFKMLDRKIPMDAHHVAKVFTEYGKFHALSLAMKEKKPNIFDEYTKHLDDIFKSLVPEEEASKSIRNLIQTGLKAVKGNKLATESLQKFGDVLEKFILEEIEDPVDQLVVLHADCWNNNMLFKYEVIDDKPSHVCFIDFQLSKMGSPVLDLAYFFFVCTAGDILNDFEKYLKIYHESVTQALKQLSCDVDTVFPYALLQQHWKKYAKFGIYIALITMKFTLCETQEELSWGEFGMTEENEDEDDNIREFNRRIVDIINVMAQHDLV